MVERDEIAPEPVDDDTARLLHHQHAPWRPTDVSQRNGRILRQGNRNPSVHINTYIVDGAPPAALSLECVLLPDGGVSFEAWGSGDDLVASSGVAKRAVKTAKE